MALNGRKGVADAARDASATRLALRANASPATLAWLLRVVPVECSQIALEQLQHSARGKFNLILEKLRFYKQKCSACWSCWQGNHFQRRYLECYAIFRSGRHTCGEERIA